MRVTVEERWNAGIKMDGRALSLTANRGLVGRLKIQAKGQERYATFTHYREGRETMILPPLWRVEVIELEDDWIVLSGLQRTAERGPLQYQEWRCSIMDKQKQW